MKRLIAAFLASTVAFVVHAQGVPQLSGQNVRTLPYLYIPFSSSTVLVRDGVRGPTGCNFRSELSARAGEIPFGYKLVQIQRAYDRDTCQELVEQGLVLKSHMRPKPAIPLYTDGNNPIFINVPRFITDGFDVSYVDGRIELKTADCFETPVEATFEFETYWFASTGWVSDVPNATASLTCFTATLQVSTTHSNSTRFLQEPLPAFSDCRQGGLQIRYAPFQLALNSSGAMSLSGGDTVTGDMQDCGENLARFMTLE